jgi:DNA-binding MarR family transcriptional regulator
MQAGVESMRLATSGALTAEDAAGSISPDAAFSKILQLVRIVETGMQNIDRSHGLSGSQLWALWHISAKSRLRVSELAEAMHIHHSTASNLLDKLEAKGLIRRERQVTDSRVVCLNLTAQGAAVVKDIPGPLQGRLRKALQALPDDVLANLCQGVSSVLGAMTAPSR